MKWKTSEQYPTEACEKEQSPIERALLELFAQAQQVEIRAGVLQRRLCTVTAPSPKLANSPPTGVGQIKSQSSMRDQIDMIKAKLDEAETIINITINELEL